MGLAFFGGGLVMGFAALGCAGYEAQESTLQFGRGDILHNRTQGVVQRHGLGWGAKGRSLTLSCSPLCDSDWAANRLAF